MNEGIVFGLRIILTPHSTYIHSLFCVDYYRELCVLVQCVDQVVVQLCIFIKNVL